MTWNNAIKNLVDLNEKVLRDQFRFKFAFSHCKTYDDIYPTISANNRIQPYKIVSLV